MAVQHATTTPPPPTTPLDVADGGTRWHIGLSAVAAAAALAMLALGPPAPLIVGTPVLVAHLVVPWRYVATLALVSTAATAAIVTTPPPTDSVGFVAQIATIGAVATVLAWRRERDAAKRLGRRPARAHLRCADGALTLAERATVALVDTDTVVVWLPARGGSRLICVALAQPCDQPPLEWRLWHEIPALLQTDGLTDTVSLVADTLDATDPGVRATFLELIDEQQIAAISVGDPTLVSLDGARPEPLAVEAADTLADARLCSSHRHELEAGSRVAVLAGADTIEERWLRTLPSCEGVGLERSAERLWTFAGELGASYDAVVVAQV